MRQARETAWQLSMFSWKHTEGTLRKAWMALLCQSHTVGLLKREWQSIWASRTNPELYKNSWVEGRGPRSLFSNSNPQISLLLSPWQCITTISARGDSGSNVSANALKKRINFTDKEKANENYTENISYLSDLQKSTSQIQYHIGTVVGIQTFS